jgi:predicted nuclease with TOPRIM domain
LNTNIETITKEIVVVKYKIENVTISISNMVNMREEYKNSIKTTSKVEERTKLQEQIDELTSKIKISKEELESLSSKREELITEETTIRTDLSYTSNTLK